MHSLLCGEGEEEKEEEERLEEKKEEKEEEVEEEEERWRKLWKPMCLTVTDGGISEEKCETEELANTRAKIQHTK